MKLILGSILLAFLIGFARGGRLPRLVETRLRAPWLVVAGLFLQVVPLPSSMGWLPVPLLIGPFVLLMAFVVLNLPKPGFALILVGVALNFVVIAMNHGMPVSRHALTSSGQMGTLAALEAGGAKHHLAGPEDTLMSLGDVISLGSRLHQIVSVGDVATYGGVMWFVAGSMGRRRRTLGAAPSVVGDPA